MELPTEADYRKYDTIWRRVAPDLNPYPEARESESAALSLPGAEANPCCMGTEASESIEVIQGFYREEIADARIYRILCRQTAAPDARRLFRAIAETAASHAKMLQAAIYLITARCYRVEVCFDPPRADNFCALLRERYHEEACDAFNYARAAAEAGDPCLKRLFAAFSDDEYRHAEQLRALLARAL